MSKLQQVAEKVGVSQNTVRRVLRGENKEVWPSSLSRAQRVREVARQLGYLPNGVARSMRKGHFNTIGLVLNTDEGRSYTPSHLLKSIHDSLAEHQTHLLVSILSDEKLTNDAKVPAILRELRCDGLLINYTDRVPSQMVQLISKYAIPAIWINRKQPHDAVYYDDQGGARSATEHLLKLGHRRIIYLDFLNREAWDATHYSRGDRYEGYAQAMRQAGLTPIARDQYAGVPVEDRLEATVHLLRGEDRPTAIIGYDGGTRILYAANLAGLRVPHDLSIVTSGTAPASPGQQRGEEFLGRTIGLMSVPVAKAGAEAVKLVQKKIAAPRKQISAHVLPLEFIPGDTCGRASNDSSAK